MLEMSGAVSSSATPRAVAVGGRLAFGGTSGNANLTTRSGRFRVLLLLRMTIAVAVTTLPSMKEAQTELEKMASCDGAQTGEGKGVALEYCRPQP